MTPLLEVTGVTRDYRGLRPLRIETLRVADGERVALVGFDALAAEVFLNLVTGATLPEAGEIRLFGRLTRDISDSADWLGVLDRLGIVSERAVLLDALTPLQNLAIPQTLDVEPLAPDVRARAESLAREVELDPLSWDVAVGVLPPGAAMRIRLGRALALDPAALLLEHVSATLEPADASAFAATIVRIADRRKIAIVSLGADERFARLLARRVLRWEPATGRLAERRGWFGGRLG